MLVRTWNVFHGRTSPPGDRLYLEPMIRLVTVDRPEVVALQEVPVWALRRLEGWSGMTAVGAVAVPPLAGPLARPLTALDPPRLRSALTGQANAVLVARRLRLRARPRAFRLNPRVFRRREARRAGLSARERLEWAWNRRVCQALSVEREGGTFVVANLHASRDRRLAREELRRAAALLDGSQPCILCGDFNVPRFAPPGFSAPIAGIDQIAVRGFEFERGPERWDEASRRLGGVLLSDHAPVEAVIA